jgi:hypothetical protein
MPELITLTCPTCGARLRVTGSEGRLVCSHCGNQHYLRLAEGGLRLKPVRVVPRNADLAATEFRIDRLKQEVAAMEVQIHRLATGLIERDHRQACSALVGSAGLSLRALKVILDEQERAEPCRLLEALDAKGLRAYLEQYEGSPLIMPRKRAAGADDVRRLIALREEAERLEGEIARLEGVEQ